MSGMWPWRTHKLTCPCDFTSKPKSKSLCKLKLQNINGSLSIFSPNKLSMFARFPQNYKYQFVLKSKKRMRKCFLCCLISDGASKELDNFRLWFTHSSLVSSLILNPAKLCLLGLHIPLSSPPKELQSNDPRLIPPSQYTLTPSLARMPTVMCTLTSGPLYVSID